MIESCASIIQSTKDLGKNFYALPESDMVFDWLSGI
jgi:hypothetical protein